MKDERTMKVEGSVVAKTMHLIDKQSACSPAIRKLVYYMHVGLLLYSQTQTIKVLPILSIKSKDCWVFATYVVVLLNYERQQNANDECCKVTSKHPTTHTMQVILLNL